MSKSIQRIYIACYKGDFHLTRICVASVRYWYPNIPITLVKDYTAGDFDTSIIEQYWNVDILDLQRKKFGWSFIKLEPFFLEPKEKMFMIDSDIVFIGPILDKLNEYDTDFIVQQSNYSEAKIASHYYKTDLVKKHLYADFYYPGYIFNCGQIVGTSGLLKKDDFNHLVSYEGFTPSLKYPEIFSHADQGIMNYTLHLKEMQNKLTVGNYPLSIWAGSPEMDTIDLAAIKGKKDKHPQLVHYAGSKPLQVSKMQRYDVLDFYETLYYSKVPSGSFKRSLDKNKRVFYFSLVNNVKKIIPRNMIDAVKKRI